MTLQLGRGWFSSAYSDVLMHRTLCLSSSALQTVCVSSKLAKIVSVTTWGGTGAKGQVASLGNWDSGGGKRRTLVNPTGDVTDDGFVVVDNTGFFVEDLLEVHTAGAFQCIGCNWLYVFFWIYRHAGLDL